MWLLVLLALAAQHPGTDGTSPDAARVAKLELPRPLRAGETVSLEVQVGALARGDEIEIRTDSGRLLGTISPFGRRAAAAGATYTIPAPRDALSEGKLTVRLTIKHRAPTREEVKSVKLKIRPPAA